MSSIQTYTQGGEDFEETAKRALESPAFKSLHLVFTKKSGEVRTARCTTNLFHVPKDKHPKGTGAPPSQGLVRFFDLDLQEWRSCNLSQITEIGYDVEGLTIRFLRVNDVHEP